MKSTLLAIALFGGLLSSAQTLTQSFNEPKIGDVQKMVRLDTSEYLVKVPVDSTGLNFHWNFSKLHTSSDPIVTNFVDTSAVPASTAYPLCNIVQDDGGFYTFLKSVTTPTTRTEVLGLSLPFGTTTFTNSGIAAVYPISAGSSFTDNIAGTAVLTGSTFPLSGKISYTADGTGTLTLADGFTYTNVLRVKTTLSITATLFIIPVGTIVQTSYDYYAPTEKFPVLSIGYQSFSTFGGSPSVTATYAGNSRSFTGIQELTNNNSDLHIYPNPATDQVFLTTTLGLSNSARLSVFSVTGALVQDTNVEGNGAFSVSHLSAGLYQVVVTDKNQRYTQKLVIQER